MTPDDRMVVHGAASRSMAPDVATLLVIVKEVDEDRRVAFERCGPRVNEVVSRLQALVGGDGRVTTGNIRVHRHYDEFTEPSQRRELHAASGQISVECSPELAGQVMSQSVALGVDELRGLRYLVRDPSPVRDELLGAAVGEARRKAGRLAQAAERSLGPVVGVEEHSSRRWEDDEGGAISVRAAAADVDLQPAELELAVSVRVTFALV